MKKRAFLWALCACFFCFCSLIWSPALSVYADIEPISVELSLEQTFALYGSEFDALGYTSSNGVGRIKFYYVGTSDDFLSLQHNVPFRNYYDQSSGTDGMVSGYNSQKFLIYACDSSLINDTSHLFTVQIPFSIPISSIQFYRQRFWWSAETDAYVYSSSLSSRQSTIELYSTVSQSAYSQKTAVYNACYLPNNSTSLFGFPLMETDLTFGGSRTMVGTGIDLYYMPFDSDNQHINFDVSGMNLYLKQIKRYSTPSTIADWFGSDYQGDNALLNLLLNKNCFFLYIAPPIVSDGFVLPEPEIPDTPDYSDQIDNINTNTTNISANLSAILAKLDLIYARMGVDISGTVNISSSSISGIGSAIQGLFVPSQSDLLTWRLNMQILAYEKLTPFMQMQDIRDTAFNRVIQAAPVGYVDVPFLDLTGAGVDFKLTASDFPDFQTVDDKLRIPLTTSDSDWAWFYDLAKWGIDVICTLAFINMAINKLHSFFIGHKVVDSE